MTTRTSDRVTREQRPQWCAGGNGERKQRPSEYGDSTGAKGMGGLARRLEETDLSVETIADRFGLSSAVNLRRRFHQALRTTPAAYRRTFHQARTN